MDLWINRFIFKVRKIFFIQPSQFLFHIHIAIQINITVGWVVILSVEVQKLLISQLWDHLRISTWINCISRIRKKRTLDHAVQHTFRWRVRSFHLVIYNSADRQFPIRIIQFIAPAFLAESLILLVDIRIKYRIHIHMHQILKILIIAACNRINRLVRIRHCVQKCIQRSLYQLDKRIFHRKFSRSAQNWMFHNMRNSRAVGRRRTETDRKDLIFIIILHQKYSRTTLFMLQKRSFGLQIR